METKIEKEEKEYAAAERKDQIFDKENSNNCEKRKDLYESALLIEFPQGSQELITFDEATKLYNSYYIIDDDNTALYLKNKIKEAKKFIRNSFPDEEK